MNHVVVILFIVWQLKSYVSAFLPTDQLNIIFCVGFIFLDDELFEILVQIFIGSLKWEGSHPGKKLVEVDNDNAKKDKIEECQLKNEKSCVQVDKNDYKT